MRKFFQSDELRKILAKLFKKDKASYDAVFGKMNEVINSVDINHYKNLKRPLQHLKRVHVGHFVLLFKYNPSEDNVTFVMFSHHDEAYS